MRSGAATQQNHNKKQKKEWNWHPNLPIDTNPLFSWPLKPKKIAKWYAQSWTSLSEITIFLTLATITWAFLYPPLENIKSMPPQWIIQTYLRNIILLFTIAGGLHLYLHTYKKQGKKLKYDPRELATHSKRFKFNDQVKDNIFWTTTSGATIWTLYEIVLIAALANHITPSTYLENNPIWFIAFFFIIILWESFHFYWIHRLLHWKPLYDIAHAIHHRNINIGPWSGLSMHPIEHTLYFSSVLIHIFIPSHPIHILFHLYWLTLGACTSHSGFEGLIVKNKNQLNLGTFFHQLHHRYFECNYGHREVPWDKVFGSFHDGTENAKNKIKQRIKKMTQIKQKSH